MKTSHRSDPLDFKKGHLKEDLRRMVWKRSVVVLGGTTFRPDKRLSGVPYIFGDGTKTSLRFLRSVLSSVTEWDVVTRSPTPRPTQTADVSTHRSDSVRTRSPVGPLDLPRQSFTHNLSFYSLFYSTTIEGC